MKRISPSRKVGRPVTPGGHYARTVGLTTRQVRALGGPERIAAMHPDALRTLLNQLPKARSLRATFPKG